MTEMLSGFRQKLERATRIEGEGDNSIDWSVHTVDYSAFKKKLRHFSKRRAELRSLLAAETTVSQVDLDRILGPTPDLPPNMMKDEPSQLLLPTPHLSHEGDDDHGPGNKQQQQQQQQTEKDGDEDVDLLDDAPTSYIAFVEEASPATTTTTAVDPTSGTLLEEGEGSRTDEQQQPPSSSSKKKHFWSRKPKRYGRQHVMRTVTNLERNEIVIFLSQEIDKVAMFYLSQWQKLSQQIVDYPANLQKAREHQLGLPKTAQTQMLVELGQEILELEAFCVVNVVTLRQLLIRYDAFARAFEGTPMLHYYMKTLHSQKSVTSFKKIFQHEELHALADRFLTLCYQQNSASTTDDTTQLSIHFQEQRIEFYEILESSGRVEAMSLAGHAAPIEDTFMENMRYYFLLGMIEDRLGYEPKYLISRGTSLLMEMQILGDWRTRDDKKLKKHLPAIDEDEDEKEAKLTGQQIFNLVMALLAAFLYCMNYYIVEPSSTMYVNALGAPDAMSGTLIGMMPIASFLAATVYSVWTNHSFRNPFIVSCLLLLTGNILYAVAFNFKSIWMALIGRFMTGLGGPKCIVRRYMADTTSLSIRTSVNAGFGMAVAAGSALGPGCAILLHKLDFSFQFGKYGQLWFNGMTGPGYFMAFLWLLFLIALMFDFREPERSGLEQQKRREKKKKKKSSGDSAAGLMDDLDDYDMLDDDCLPKVTISKSASTSGGQSTNSTNTNNKDDDLMTIFSGATSEYNDSDWKDEETGPGFWAQMKKRSQLITFPVRICLGLLFAKVFVIETLVSATSALSKNRYGWTVNEVGTLGCVNGLSVIPLSIIIGKFSMSYQDRYLMLWQISIGLVGVFLLIDISDLIDAESKHYNEGHPLAVGEFRYILGYILTYMSIQSFEGVIGSALSKTIPTALASGTFNSGLLATLVDTFGRSCGDLFISLCGFINLRQLMNLLFIPGFVILLTCLFVVRRHYDLLAV